jgi:hypothetical protein
VKVGCTPYTPNLEGAEGEQTAHFIEVWVTTKPNAVR